MKSIKRYLANQAEADLERKMVFVTGPRQAGKTTLALSLPGARTGYLNWDVAEHRSRILQRELPDSSLWVFDEIHKHRQWRDWLKGLYDVRASGQRILVTGSGRLDLYRFGGDSLQGRYRLLRLHPLSFAELGLASTADLNELLTLGGFPEPWTSASATEAKRWSMHYRAQIVHEEAASLEGIRNLGQAETTLLALPERVGSPLSINSLRELLHVSHHTMSAWLDAFERLYAIFRVPAFVFRSSRAVQKERKHYHFDWTVVPDPGARFENLVACHLLKWTHWRQDAFGEELALHYYRDRDGREVDFVVTQNREPQVLIECKRSDGAPSRGLRYLHSKFPNAKAWQIAAEGHKNYKTPSGIRVAPAQVLLQDLV